MGGLPRVTQVRSLSRAGLSQVVVVFEDGVDPYFARQLVFERLQGAREQLPPGIEPELAPLSTGLGEIFQYTLEGEGFTPMEKRTIQDWLVAPQLRTVPGVTEVNSFGGFVKQYQVAGPPERLAQVRPHPARRRRGRRAQQRQRRRAASSSRAGSRSTSAASGLFASDRTDIENVVLKAEDGTPVFLRDVADVASAPSPARAPSPATARARPSPAWSIMLRGENSKTVVAAGSRTRSRTIQERAARGAAHRRLLRPHRADRGLHQDRHGRAARGRRSSSSSCSSCSSPSCARR